MTTKMKMTTPESKTCVENQQKTKDKKMEAKQSIQRVRLQGVFQQGSSMKKEKGKGTMKERTAWEGKPKKQEQPTTQQ